LKYIFYRIKKNSRNVKIMIQYVYLWDKSILCLFLKKAKRQIKYLGRPATSNSAPSCLVITFPSFRSLAVCQQSTCIQNTQVTNNARWVA
jgi:hypothetical protein